MADNSQSPRLARQALDALRPQRAGVVYALILIVLIFEVMTIARGLPSFLQVSDIRNVLQQGALDGVLVVSMTVLLITGNFDLSVGATAGLAAAAGLKVANADGEFLGVLAAVGVGLAVGIANGTLVQVVGVNAFIVTLGTYTALQGVLLVLTSGNTILAKSGQYGAIGSGVWSVPAVVVIVIGAAMLAYALARARGWGAGPAGARLDSSAIGAGIIGLILVVVGIVVPGIATENAQTWIMLGYMTAAALVLRFTVVGRRIYAVGGNAEAARLSGIAVSRYKIGAFILTSLSASLAGLIYAGQFGAVEPTALVNEELPVLAAAILGGTSLFGGSGYVVKSVVGTLILSSLIVGFNILNLGSNWQYVVQGLVIIAAAAVYTVASRKRRAASIVPDSSTSEPGPSDPAGTPAAAPDQQTLAAKH
ncbi:MAG TPA: ABC transporter permease [Solirubrobacteraceae bacterium]|nr:ABC transporter permease [Solirubrobacteraceae bacterium]